LASAFGRVRDLRVRDGKLLLIRKKAGPYANRYDLPGGSAEPDETLADALRREFREETGAGVHIIRCLGVQEFVVPHRSEASGTTHLHHIAIYCEVACLDGEASLGAETDNNDSAGAEWVELGALNSDNSLRSSCRQWTGYGEGGLEDGCGAI